MTQLITNYFRLHNLQQFRESINETANSVYYVFAGRHTQYPSGDTTIPSITNSVDNTLYNAYTEMIFGKRVGPSDVAAMVPRYNWSTNTYFDAYRSNADLTDKKFYTVVETPSTFYVFKCLDNAGNSASIVAPDITQTSANDEFYSTSDGYVWKYMYSVDATTFNKFATSLYMPVVTDANVVLNAVDGTVDVITVDYKGSNYGTYFANTFNSPDVRVGGNPLIYNLAVSASSNSGFYEKSFIYIKNGTGAGQGRKITSYNVTGSNKQIIIEAPAFEIPLDNTSQYEITPFVAVTGDGDGVVARALVNTSQSNSISGVEIINRGTGYSYASAVVEGNTGGTTNTAVLTVVLGPKGGHGSNPEYELGSRTLGISVTYNVSESGSIPVVNDYRSVGIIKDPLYANVVFTVASPTGAFQIGETVIQQNTGAQGVVAEWDSVNTLTLTDVNGVFLTGNTSVNKLQGLTSSSQAVTSTIIINGQSKNFNTFDQRRRWTFTDATGTFLQDEIVYPSTRGIAIANAVFHSNTAGSLYLTHVQGVLNNNEFIQGATSGASARILFGYPADIVVGSGEVLFTENKAPITRTDSQSEIVKLFLHF